MMQNEAPPLACLVRVRLRRLVATGSIVRERGGVGARGVCRKGGGRFPLSRE